MNENNMQPQVIIMDPNGFRSDDKIAVWPTIKDGEEAYGVVMSFEDEDSICGHLTAFAQALREYDRDAFEAFVEMLNDMMEQEADEA